MNELEKIQKAFLWNNSTPKIKHETLCNDYKVGRLNNDDSFHEWKLIPLHLIGKSLALLLSFIQIYSLKVIKPSFSYLSIGKLF